MSRNIFSNLFYILLAGFTAMVLTCCKSKTVYVPVETVKTEYRDRITRDSVRLYDSIFIREANDTVRIERFKVVYRDKIKRDSIFIHDSIQVPYPVIEYREINKLHSWQIILMCMGGFMIGYSGCYLFRVIADKFLR